MEMYNYERKRLNDLIPEKLLGLFEEGEESFFIAGGAITSVFTNKEINDIDIYPKTKEAKLKILEFMDSNCYVASCTDKSVYAIHSGTYDLNVVILNEYGTADDIFKSFDFSIVKGAYDVDSEKFFFHDYFFVDLSKRFLRVDTNTSFPLMSVIRMKKYVDRGYTVSVNEMAKVLLKVTTLSIESVEDLEMHLGGTYGTDFKDVFKDKDFSLDVAIDHLSNASCDYTDNKRDDKTNEKLSRLIESIEADICNNLDLSLYRQMKGIVYKKVGLFEWLMVSRDDIVYSVKEKIPTCEPIENEYIHLFKYVKQDSEGVLRSNWKNSFIYTIGEEAVAKGDYLYFYNKRDLDRGMYKTNKGPVVLNAKVYLKDVNRVDGNVVKVDKCTAIEIN